MIKYGIWAVLMGVFMTVLIATTANSKPVEIIPEPRFIIEDDHGGNLDDFIPALLFAKANGMKFEIRGECVSACTLILTETYGLDLCIRPDVKFGFHKPFAARGGRDIVRQIPYVVGAEKLWRTVFYQKFPDFIRKSLDKVRVPSVIQGDSPSDVVWITYAELKDNIKTCGENR